MKSKTLIKKQTQKKFNSEIVETVKIAKDSKNKSWYKIAEILSRARRKKIIINLNEIEKISKEGDIIVVPGKVLSQGEVSKKIRVVALQFSQEAKEKLLKSKCELIGIDEEIKKNPEAKGIKFIGVKND